MDLAVLTAVVWWDHIFLYLGQAAAAITALGVVYKFAVSPVILAVRKISSMYDKVNTLVGQLEHTNGGSIRELLNRIESSIFFQDARQRILLNLASFGIMETNAQGKIVFTNRTLGRWTAQTDSDMLGDGWFSFVHADDVDRVRSGWLTAVAEMRMFESRFRVVGYRRTYTVLCKLLPIYHKPGGKVEGWFGVLFRCHHEHSGIQGDVDASSCAHDPSVPAEGCAQCPVGARTFASDLGVLDIRSAGDMR